MARSYNQTEAKKVYDQVNSGFTTVDRLSDQSKGDLYQYLIDNGKADIDKFNSSVKSKYGLSSTPKALGILDPYSQSIEKLDTTFRQEPSTQAPISNFRETDDAYTKKYADQIASLKDFSFNPSGQSPQTNNFDYNDVSAIPAYNYNQPTQSQPTTQSNQLGPIDKFISSLASVMGSFNIGTLQAAKEIQKATEYINPVTHVRALLDPEKSVADIIDKDTTLFNSLLQQQQNAVRPYQEQAATITGPDKYIYGALGQVAQLPFMGAGAIPAVTALSGFAAGSKANEIEQGQIARGIDPNSLGATATRLGGAALSGSMEAVTEIGPMATFFDIMGGKITSDTILKELNQEFLGEGLSEAMSPYIDKAVFSDTELPTIKQQLVDFVDAGFTGAMSAVLMMGVGMGIQSASQALNNPTTQNVDKALQDVENQIKIDLNADGEATQGNMITPTLKLDGQIDNTIPIVPLTSAKTQKDFFTEQAAMVEPEVVPQAEINPNLEKYKIDLARKERLLDEANANKFEAEINPNFDKIATPTPKQETSTAPTVQKNENIKTTPTIELIQNTEESLTSQLSSDVVKKLKDTKIVDKQGNPQVVYHGTPTNFEGEFTLSTAPRWGIGIYFSDSKNAIINEFADGKDGNVIPVLLDIKNPFTGSYPGDQVIQDTNAYRSALSKANNGIDIEILDENYFDNNPDANYLDPNDLWSEDGNFANDVIQELGYDGIVAKGSNSIDGNEIVVFKPSQVIRMDQAAQTESKDQQKKEIVVPETPIKGTVDQEEKLLPYFDYKKQYESMLRNTELSKTEKNQKLIQLEKQMKKSFPEVAKDISSKTIDLLPWATYILDNKNTLDKKEMTPILQDFIIELGDQDYAQFDQGDLQDIDVDRDVMMEILTETARKEIGHYADSKAVKAQFNDILDAMMEVIQAKTPIKADAKVIALPNANQDNSKDVTELKTGKPVELTMYQGKGKTASEIYRSIKYPILGEGSYFAFDKKSASNYGDNITESKVTLENPYVINDDVDWKKLTIDAGWKYSNPTYLEKDTVIADIKKLKYIILAKGYDGVIVSYENNSIDADINRKTNNTVKTLRNVFGHDQIVSYRNISTVAIDSNQKSKNAKYTKKEAQAKWNELTEKYKGRFDLVNNIDLKYESQYNTMDQIKDQIKKFYSTVEDLNNGASVIEETYGQNLDKKGIGIYRKFFLDELVDTGKVKLIGQTITSHRELATLMQIFRNPKYETAFIIGVKNGKVTYNRAVSSRLPNCAVVFASQQEAIDLSDDINRIDFDDVYMVHNHPSGNPTPSIDDIRISESFASHVKNYKGHVIINSGKYFFIPRTMTESLNWRSKSLMHNLDLGKDKLLAFQTNALQKDTAGKEIAKYVKGQQLDDNKISVVYLSTKLTIKAIETISANDLKSISKKYLDNMQNKMLGYGAYRVVLVSTPVNEDLLKVSTQAIKQLDNFIIQNDGSLKSINGMPSGSLVDSVPPKANKIKLGEEKPENLQDFMLYNHDVDLQELKDILGIKSENKKSMEVDAVKVPEQPKPLLNYNLEAKDGFAGIEKDFIELRKGDMPFNKMNEYIDFVVNNEKSIVDLANKRTKAQLAKYVSPFNVNDFNKAQYVQSAYQEQLNNIIFTLSDSKTISTSGFNHENKLNQLRDQVKKLQEGLTKDKYQSIVDKIKQEAIDKKTASMEKKNRIDNPETLDDYILASKSRVLTTEERRKLDDLKLAAKQSLPEAKAMDKVAVSADVIGKLVEGTHTKTGNKLFEFELTDRIEKNEWSKILEVVKKEGGSYWKGKFFFPTESIDVATQKYNNVINTLKGNMTETVDNIVDKSTSNADRLRTVASNMQKAIDEKYAGRQTNTNRRAAMAASAQMDGDRMKRTQAVLNQIADALDSGELKFLSKINSKAQIESLDGRMSRAKHDYINDVTKGYQDAYMSELKRRELKGEPVTIDGIDFAKVRTLYKEHVIKMLEEGTKIKGMIQKSNSALNSAKRHQDDLPVYKFEEILNELISKGVNDFGSVKSTIQDFNRLKKLGIETDGDLRAALREYLPFFNSTKISKETQIERNIKQRESEFTRQKIEGFFPTPENIVDNMIEIADIKEGEKILEPSAGVGHIADKISKGTLDVVEYNNSMAQLLKDKGHNVVGNNALEVKTQYNKIIMNPPFENSQDIEHVMYAYENNLLPGGRLVAIMSEGPFFRSDKKATAFREWLDGLDQTNEQLPDGTFKESDRKTGVNTRIVVISKPVINDIDSIKASNPKVNTNDIATGAKASNELIRASHGKAKSNPLEARHSLPALTAAIENNTLEIDNLIIPNATASGYTYDMKEFIVNSIANRDMDAQTIVMKIPDDGTMTLLNSPTVIAETLHALGIKVKMAEIPKNIASYVKNSSIVVTNFEGYKYITTEGNSGMFITPNEFKQLTNYIEQVSSIDPTTKLKIEKSVDSIAQLNKFMSDEYVPVSNFIDLVGEKNARNKYTVVSGQGITRMYNTKLLQPFNGEYTAYQAINEPMIIFKDSNGLLVGATFPVKPSPSSMYELKGNFDISLKPKALTKPSSLKWMPTNEDLLLADINDGKPSNGPKAAATYVQKLYPMQGVGKGEKARLSDAQKLIDKFLEVPVKEGNFRQHALGIFKSSGIIRVKNAKQMDVLMHEVGHWFDQHFDLTNKITANPLIAGELYNAGKPVSRKTYTKKEVIQEGIAEFFSTYLQSKELAQQNFIYTYNAIEDVIKTDKVTKELTSALNELMDQYMKMNSSERVLSNVQLRPRRHEITKPEEIISTLYTAMVDINHPIYNFVRDVVGKVNPSSDPMTKKRLAVTSGIGKTTTAMERGLIDPKTGNFLTKGLYEIIAPVRESKMFNEFMAYAVSMRANELTERGIETGIDIKDVNATISKYKNDVQFNKTLKEIYKYNDTLLKIASMNDLITPEAYEQIKEVNRYYMPFNRVINSAASGKRSKAGNPIMKIKGSYLDIINPIESIVRNTYSIYNAIDVNEANKTLFNYHNADGAGKYFDKIPPPIKAIEIEGDTLAELIKKNYDIDISNEVDKVTLFQPNMYPNKDNVITVLNKGKREFYEIHNKDMLRVFTQADYPQLKIIGKILGFPARVLRAGATEFSDAFVLRNFIKDTVAASVFSQSNFIPFVHSVRGIYEEMGKTDLYYKALSAGAINNTASAIDRDYIKKDTRKLYEKDFADNVLGVISRPLDALRGLNEAVESSTRLGEFRQSYNKNIQKGMSEHNAILQAALDSRDLMDFMRAGYIGREINKLIPFFNASIQGVDKFARSAVTNPVNMLVKGGMLAAFSAMLYLMNSDDERYNRLDRYTKDMYWIAFIGDEIVKIPKPQELGLFFGSGTERMVEYLKENDPKAFKGYKERVIEMLLPEFIPQVYKVHSELASGYSMFYKGSIVPLSESSRPKYLQYGTTTSEFAKEYGRTFNESPRMVDYAITQSLGTAGRFLLNSIDSIILATGKGEKIEDPAKTLLGNMPFVRGLIASPYTGSVYVEDFYEYTNEVKVKAAEYRELDQEYPADFAKNYTYIKKMYKTMTKLNGVNKAIKESTLSGDEKKALLVDIQMLQDSVAIKTMNGELLTSEELQLIAKYDALYEQD